MKIMIVASDFAIGKGGLQSFAYYIRESVRYKKLLFDEYSRKEKSLKTIFALLKANICKRLVILTDWEQCIFVYPALMLAKIGILKSKFAVVLHGNEILNLKGIKKFLLTGLSKHKRVYFIANSTGTGEIFTELFNRKIDYIAYPFIDSESIDTTQAQTAKKSASKKKKTILTITRLVKRKNVAGVIGALALLKKKGLEFEYIVLGSGPDFDSLQDQVKELGLSGSVKLKGAVSEEEKISDLASANLFVLPSLYDKEDGSIEGYGIVFIEASLFGVPCVSGDTGGMTDAVVPGVTGFHSDGTVNDIAQKIEKALKTKFSKEKMIAHAKAHDFRVQDGFIDFLKSLQK